jgi:FMN phosphatase YigB (HAD superfamily)
VEKPDPEIFARACARAGVLPSEALHAGDDVQKDVLGAQRAGLLTARVDHASTPVAGNSIDPATGAPKLGSLWALSEWIARVP